MTKILIDLRVDSAGLERLRAVPNVAIDINEAVRDEPAELPTERIADADILLTTIPPTNERAMTKLRLVQIASVGYSQLYGRDYVKRGVRACNARGVFDVPIAEWNIAMMVNLVRDMRGMIRNQDAGVWDRDARFQTELRGLTVGLWGYGGIGRETARLAKALGLNVHVLSRSAIGPRGEVFAVPGTGDPMGALPDRTFTPAEKDAFLASLDFLILAMPLTPATEGLIGEHELRQLRKGAYVLNPARGPLIQEEPLLAALRDGHLGGAALDTHYHYPMPSDHPLWLMDNVIMTPHISGSSESPHYLTRTWDIFVQNVQRFVAGKTLLNELTAAQLDGA